MRQEKKISSDAVAALAKHSEIMTGIYDAMAKRGEKLHEGQIQIARDLFVHGKRVIQSQWGRSGGKTLAACYIAWTYALLHPGSIVYIICPQRKQGKDIYWVSGRIQNFGPRDWVEQAKESEITVQFKNTSAIKIDGCENYEAHRGVKPNLVIYDEFQHHSKEFHMEVMQPNLTAKKASLMVFGTPPKKDCYYVQFRKELLDEIKAGDDSRAYYEFPSHINPSLDKEELEKMRKRLMKSGDEKIWLREYMGQLIWGGEGAVFAPWSREKHIRAHSVITASLEKDKKGLKWYAIFDPGNMTCFAILFIAYNPYTSQVFLLDEIYETNPQRTDAKSIWERAVAKEFELYPGCAPRTWRRIYDEAAQWFYVNVEKMFHGSRLIPCEKNKIRFYSSKEADCSLIKQIMGQDNVFYVSERCQKFVWEVENYVLDDDGDYPDEHDHLIDCLTYFLKAANFRFIEDVPADEQLLKISGSLMVGQSKKVVKLRDAGTWSDNVVDESLWIDNPYDEYFN
jgi:hypothetical protein